MTIDLPIKSIAVNGVALVISPHIADLPVGLIALRGHALAADIYPEPVVPVTPTRVLWKVYVDGTEIPATAIRMRLREGSNDYLKITAVYNQALEAFVFGAAGEQIKVDKIHEYSDGSTTSETFAEATIETASVNRQSGFEFVAYASAATGGNAIHLLENLTYLRMTVGGLSVRMPAMYNLKPGDLLKDAATGVLWGVRSVALDVVVSAAGQVSFFCQAEAGT